MCICTTTLGSLYVRLPGLSGAMSECGCPTCVTRRIEKGLDKTPGLRFEEGYSDACSDDGWVLFQVELRHVENVRVEVLVLVVGFGIALTVECMANVVGLRRGFKATDTKYSLYFIYGFTI